MEKIWIYGASSSISLLFNKFSVQQDLFQGIIDSVDGRRNLIHSCAPGLKMTSLAEAKEKGCDAIVIATAQYEDVKASIRQAGLGNIQMELID